MNYKHMFHEFILIILTFVFTACGGGGNTDTSIDTIEPSNNADYMSSYENSKTSIHIDYSILPLEDYMLRDAIAYLDVDGDNDIDVFIGTGEWQLEGEIDSLLSLNNGEENFISSTSEFMDNMPPATHARKALVSDFNGDGLKDMLILDHGYDAEPFPGNQPKLIMQESLGKFSWEKLPDVGFHHSGAAADIDNDGDIDIFIADHHDISGNYPSFYINDGNGNFARDISIFGTNEKVVYGSELIDIDKDGYIDLLTGAHEREGHKTSIYWGSSIGKYTTAHRTIIPVVPQMGVILDFDAEDIDGDGDRDIIINRTRDGDDGGGLGFYVGRTIQLLRNDGNRNFTDVTLTHIDNPGGDHDDWIPWLRVQDFDGDKDVDIRPDNAQYGLEYKNDGTGKFTKVNITL